MLTRVTAIMPLQASIKRLPTLPAARQSEHAASATHAPRCGYSFGNLSIFPAAAIEGAGRRSRVAEADAPTGQAAAADPAPTAGAAPTPTSPTPTSPTPASLTPASTPPGTPQAGGSVTLPDLIMSAAAGPVEKDAVAGRLTYAPSVTQTGVAAPFGETLPYTFSMTNIVVTPPPAPVAPGPDAGAPPPAPPAKYDVTATVENPITFNVSSGGRTNVASANDAALTHANFPTAASDLTPDMGDLNGRPPRTQFWAEDLTIIHERFHATEGSGFARTGVTNAQTWLNAQTATSIADVNALVAQVPGKVIATRQAAMTFPGREQRAYAAGAPAYKARADAITAKGTAGKYPGAPAPPAPDAGAPKPDAGAP